MIFDDFKYVGYKSDLRSKTKIVDISSVVVEPKKEYYQSIYRFSADIVNYKSLAGIRKDVKFYADYLVFDIDSLSLKEAYDSMMVLVEYLTLREVSMEAWFSGSKGFHLMIPTSQFGFQPTNNPLILETMAKEIAKKCNVDIDTKIYNVSRILRLPGSLNEKSGLYKIPFNINKEYNEKEMLEMAREPIENPYCDPDDHSDNTFLTSLYSEFLVRVVVNRQILPSEDPKETRLFLRAKEGDRNDTLYKLARKLARRSIGEQDCLQICGWWATTLEKPLSENEVKRTVVSAYTKGMNLLVDEENFKKQFFDAKRCLSGVRKVIQNLNKNVIKTGFPFIDEYTMGVYRGDVIFLIARPGNFKTCILSSIMRSIAQKTQGKTIIFSMEMSEDRLSMRHIQASEHLSQLEVIKQVRAGFSFDKFKEDFKDVVIVSLSSLSIDMIIGLIDYYNEEFGDVSAIGFDYLSLFRGCANNVEATARVATELKTRVAKAANCPVFCLVQAKRAYEGFGGNVEIDRQAGKDSSSIEDSGDFLLGLWNHEGKNYGRFLKSRTFDSSRFGENPYFELELNKPQMRLDDATLVEDFDKPKFKQLERSGNG